MTNDIKINNIRINLKLTQTINLLPQIHKTNLKQ